jgi:sulfate adenylyltransferase subunit 1 (EFTu-like GTPase family)
MQRSVIRLLTCGSVDDGKSTLIGRLLKQTVLRTTQLIQHEMFGAVVQLLLQEKLTLVC